MAFSPTSPLVEDCTGKVWHPRGHGVCAELGAGVKIRLAGPLRLRVDYRAFRLGSGAIYSPAQRIYAGLNLKF